MHDRAACSEEDRQVFFEGVEQEERVLVETVQRVDQHADIVVEGDGVPRGEQILQQRERADMHRPANKGMGFVEIPYVADPFFTASTQPI